MTEDQAEILLDILTDILSELRSTNTKRYKSLACVVCGNNADEGCHCFDSE